MLKSTAGEGGDGGGGTGQTHLITLTNSKILVSHKQEMVKIKENTLEGLLKYKIKI